MKNNVTVYVLTKKGVPIACYKSFKAIEKDKSLLSNKEQFEISVVPFRTRAILNKKGSY